MRRHARWGSLAAAAALLGTAGATAADETSALFHWGYAASFGSGVYSLADGTEARVVRLPFAKTVREPGPQRVGVRLLFPLTVAVQNLDEDLLEPGRPDDRIEEAALVPGVEFELAPADRVTLRVRGQAGWGKELEGAEDTARLFAVGLRSRIRWEDAPGRPSLINGLLWGGVDPETAERRALLRVTQAMEFDVAVPRWEFRDETMHLRPHVLVDWFYDPPPALSFGDDSFRHIETEWQIGLAAGRATGFRVLGFEFDGVGLAYRFSDHRHGIRFFIGSVF